MKKRRTMANPMDRIAAALYDRYAAGKRSAGAARVDEEVIALEGGRREAARDYQIRKLADTLLVTALLLLLGLAVLLWTLLCGKPEPRSRLARDVYGGMTRSRELVAQVEQQSESLSYTVRVGARKYTDREAETMLEAARDELEEVLLGENESRDAVRTDLCLPERLLEGSVQAEYLTVPYGMISQQGEIVGEAQETGSLVEIKATLTCQEQTLIYDTAVMVYPRALPAGERLREDIREALAQADQEQAESEYLELPAQVAGRRITWRDPPWQGYKLALLWCLLLPPLLWFGRDARVHRQAGERRLQLAIDYPDILWRMTMLLGAGMSVRGAFVRIVSGYERNRARTGRRCVYEEMGYTLREMDSGVGEAAAYEHFGQRCALPCFIKLGSLLAANVRKGSADLRDMLEKEAETAMEERKNLALREGERAGTKMLFPMLLMLGVVLAVLLVPAFLAMG